MYYSLLTNQAQHALNALDALARSSTPCRGEDLASRVGCTMHFMEQTLRKLRLHNLVSVKRGPGGGYRFNADGRTPLHVLKALGYELPDPTGTRASDRANAAIYDALNVPFSEFLFE